MTALLRVKEIWNRYWFGPSPALDLAMMRIVFFGLATFAYYDRLQLNWHMMREGGVWYPVSFFKAGLPVLEPAAMAVVYRVASVTYLTSCLGLFTRTSGILATLTSLYIGGVAQNFGKYTGGGTDVVLFVMAGLAFSRSGDYLSLDSLIKLRRSPSPEGNLLTRWLTPPPNTGDYRWPVRVGWLMLYVLYFTAGLSKIMKSGLDWATTENLRNLLIRHHYSHFPPTELGLWAADRAWVYKSVGVSSLFLELLCPLGMVTRWGRYVFGFGLPLMQLGIYFTLGVRFSPVRMMVASIIPYSFLFARFFPPNAGGIQSQDAPRTPPDATPSTPRSTRPNLETQ